jgi:hypothetical protein
LSNNIEFKEDNSKKLMQMNLPNGFKRQQILKKKEKEQVQKQNNMIKNIAQNNNLLNIQNINNIFEKKKVPLKPLKANNIVVKESNPVLNNKKKKLSEKIEDPSPIINDFENRFNKNNRIGNKKINIDLSGNNNNIEPTTFINNNNNMSNGEILDEFIKYNLNKKIISDNNLDKQNINHIKLNKNNNANNGFKQTNDFIKDDLNASAFIKRVKFGT